MTTPRIGEPRVYDGPILPVLYPGEQASPQFSPDALAEATYGFEIVTLAVTGWIVEPAPGWHGLVAA